MGCWHRPRYGRRIRPRAGRVLRAARARLPPVNLAYPPLWIACTTGTSAETTGGIAALPQGQKRSQP
jgi:hypothetical protein